MVDKPVEKAEYLGIPYARRHTAAVFIGRAPRECGNMIVRKWENGENERDGEMEK